MASDFGDGVVAFMLLMNQARMWIGDHCRGVRHSAPITTKLIATSRYEYITRQIVASQSAHLAQVCRICQLL